MVPTTANVLGCFAVIYTFYYEAILTASINKGRLIPVCISINNNREYSLAVFEWKSDGSIGANPVATAQYKSHNSEFSTRFTTETYKLSGKNIHVLGKLTKLHASFSLASSSNELCVLLGISRDDTHFLTLSGIGKSSG